MLIVLRIVVGFGFVIVIVIVLAIVIVLSIAIGEETNLKFFVLPIVSPNMMMKNIIQT